MTHPETAIAGLFDHEQDPVPAAGGRERPAPDWGGDDLFSSTPRRRRRARDTGEHRLAPAPAHEPWSRPRPASPAPATPPAPAAVADPAPVPATATFAEEIVPTRGRRTITVTGHPEPRIQRTRRPAPTVDQRIGHRPDRIAAWAFALGMLLILIAIVTAHTG